MKTRVSNLGQFCLTLSFCLTLASCQQDEFYEKEYLENPYLNPAAKEKKGGNNGNAHGGANNGNNGGSNAGSDYGQTNPGNNGSAHAGSQGGDDQDGVNDSANSGSAGSGNGGGQSTVDGSTNGATTGSGQGGVTGSVDGSATAGSTSGEVSSGSSNNGHGNNVDGVDSSNPGKAPFFDASGAIDDEKKVASESTDDQKKDETDSVDLFTESFIQTANAAKKLDIVWVIDNSGSMADEQGALGLNFNAFISDFITKNIDFKMAITTTDTTGANKGLMVPGSAEKLTSQKAQANPYQFLTDFKNLARVGTSGSGYEKGLEATEGFMQRYSTSFIRPDAYLAVVIVSDEEDQSPKSADHYVNYLKSFKREAGLVKVYSIVDINRTNSGYGISTGGDRYAEASLKTGGVVADIREDFHRNLSSMGDSLFSLLDSFALAHEPVDGTLKVFVDGIESFDFSYDASSRSIKFDSARLPQVGAEIKVTYARK